MYLPVHATQETDISRLDNIANVMRATSAYRSAGKVSEHTPESDVVAAAQAGDEYAVMELITRLAARLRAMVSRGGEAPRVDLEQAAMLGVLEALQTYDPNRGVAFFTHAHDAVMRGMEETVRVTDPRMVPSRSQSRYWEAMRATDYDAEKARRWSGYQRLSAAELETIADETGDVIAREIVDARYDAWERNPKGREWEEAARETGRGLEGFAFDAIHANVTYLDVQVGDDSGDLFTRHDVIAADEHPVDDAVDSIAVRQMLEALDERSAEVVRSLFGIDTPAETAADVAERLGISRPRVMNIRKEALRALAQL